MIQNKKKYTQQQKDDLWKKYSSGDSSVFNDLCEAYIPLIEIIASKHKSKLPTSIDIDDLINDGFFGLADAIKKFDSSKGYKFETYASARIRGEIMDRLRDYDPVSRYYRGKFKELTQATQSLTEDLGRTPTDEEIAEILEWPVDEVGKIRALYLNSFPTAIDEYMSESNHEKFSLSEVLADESIGSFDFLIQENDISNNLIEALDSLSEHESLVVYWKHYQNLTFITIGERLGVKVPRVSQIYGGAMNKLRGLL